jgi:ketosteroid isomerase-like protein
MAVNLPCDGYERGSTAFTISTFSCEIAYPPRPTALRALSMSPKGLGARGGHRTLKATAAILCRGHVRLQVVYGILTGRMSEESTTPDLVELTRQSVKAFNRRDFDAFMRDFAPDAVWDASFAGRFEGVAAIRGLMTDWWGAYEEYQHEIVESRDLGNGVVFTVARTDVRLAGSTGRVRETWSWTSIWVEGKGCVSVVPRADIDEARAAAGRLAEERG